MSEQINEYEWKNERMDEWMNEWMNKRYGVVSKL